MEKETQREYFNYKDDAIVQQRKCRGNSEEITHLFIKSKNDNDNS